MYHLSPPMPLGCAPETKKVTECRSQLYLAITEYSTSEVKLLSYITNVNLYDTFSTGKISDDLRI